MNNPYQAEDFTFLFRIIIVVKPKKSVNKMILVMATLGTIQLDVCQGQILNKKPSTNGMVPRIAIVLIINTLRHLWLVPMASMVMAMINQAL